MQKWEYCAIVGIGASGNGTTLTTRYPGVFNFTDKGSHITEIRDIFKDKKHPEIEEETERRQVAKAIAKLGDEGWEMVGTGNTSEGSHMIYFKRPKE